VEIRRLEPEELFWRCNLAQFDFESTRELPCLDGTIGQERALTAIEFGLGIRDSGFNIFILGEPGTGRSSTIRSLLEKRAETEPVPGDWCYVHDFDDGLRPRWLHLPQGTGRALHREMEELIIRLEEEIPKVFESKEYELQKTRISEEFQERQKALFQQLDQRAQEEGFTLQRTVSGLVLVPLKDEHPLSQQEYEDLPDSDKASLDEKGNDLKDQLNDVLRHAKDLENEMRSRTVEMEKEILLYTIGHLFEDLEEKYRLHQEVIDHFENCKKDILDRIDELRPSQGPQLAIPGMQMGRQEPSFDRYRINLLVDNGEQKGAPVVFEPNPTYFNLFGRIDHIIQMGNAVTNFTLIRSGALHRANGGYLILDCREVLLNLFSYEALKRCIRNEEIKIEDMAEQYRMIATLSLKPQPIPLNCKIILIGTPQFYYLLYQLDPDFRKFFKVKSDFDRMMKNTPENIERYASFIATKCEEEGLVHFSPDGVGRLVEHAARLIEDQGRLSSRFIDLADTLREAAYYAAREGKDHAGRDHVEQAIEAKIYRSNKTEERIQEYIDEGKILVDVEGKVPGQVNGLSVYLLGDYSFGRPTRVTVRTYLGKGGLVNIEREAKLSGPIHDKGVLILTGFFGERFAQDRPLALAASIAFEQSYSGVEGDSASSTELYALMSSLAKLPIHQGIAVTGSVDQRGQVQPIGGVNEKVEGFYAVCKAKGLTGEQGVIIPVQNVKNLMLRQEVVEAVRTERFHIWAVSNVDEGIEILTGIPSGQKRDDGTWPEGTVNYLIDQRLIEMAEAARRFGQEKEDGSETRDY
jgi:lon-related putative ATP-dependent protease